MSDTAIVQGPGNEPTRCEKISKAKLITLLPAGTALTLIHTSFKGACRKHRTVIKVSASQVVLKQNDKPEGDPPSYLKFETGDTFFLHDNGFTVKNLGGMDASYQFGHI